MAVQLDRVLIIGAGIGGLTAAIALRRAGFSVVVYEQAPEFAPVGAGITLWANAVKILCELGVAEASLGGTRIRRAVIQNSEGRFLNVMHVEALEERLGGPSLAVQRADLHRALLAELPKGTVCMDRVCTGFYEDEQSVTARFADGQVEQGSLLVGADGIHSFTRRKMFPQVGLRYAGYIAWRGVAEFALADPQQTSESWGCGSRFGIVPLGGGRVYWFATANQPAGRKRTPADRKADLRERFKGWHEPVEALIEATPDEKILSNDLYDIQPMLHWSKGRVTLLGDAAHPTTPNLGQGACQAIESSLVLARCLAKENDLSTALQSYEQARHARTAWITDQSWLFGQMAQLEQPWQCMVRDLALRATPPAVLANQLVKTAGYAIK